ncbi:MAG TPA: 2-amino-4-hydroxy-6-hydroxymethyldihydropteridine diphosphokinase [Bacillota bacterium]|nr:2-amino-4-hydroxy-6-hydroxymethyldihydropteridine diphosphokinase [Bacillota bacterium]
MKRSFIAMGTNIEPRKKYIDDAITRLRDHGQIEVKQISPIYETEPVGYLEQADFLNLVIEVQTNLAPKALLEACQEIESALGRERTFKNGPRTIDLDILTYEDEVVDKEHLTIPHPRMKDRAFVLVPFAKIARDLNISLYGKTVSDLLENLPENDLTEVRRWKGK